MNSVKKLRPKRCQEQKKILNRKGIHENFKGRRVDIKQNVKPKKYSIACSYRQNLRFDITGCGGGGGGGRISFFTSASVRTTASANVRAYYIRLIVLLTALILR